MLREFRHLDGHGSGGGDIVANDYGAGDALLAVVNGRGGVFNGGLHSIAANQDAIGSEADGPILLNGHFHRIAAGFPGIGVDDVEYVREGASNCLFSGPARHGFGDKIEIGDFAENVGAEDGIADGVQSDLRAFFLHEESLFHGPPFDHIVQRTGERVAVEVPFKQVVTGTALNGSDCNLFVIGAAQNYDRDLWGHVQETIQRFDAEAIRQE